MVLLQLDSAHMHAFRLVLGSGAPQSQGEEMSEKIDEIFEQMAVERRELQKKETVRVIKLLNREIEKTRNLFVEHVADTHRTRLGLPDDPTAKDELAGMLKELVLGMVGNLEQSLATTIILNTKVDKEDFMWIMRNAAEGRVDEKNAEIMTIETKQERASF